ncbi:hypothetical protein EX30DRAFT_380002 [Ascodesmis nigricans]|uniref:Uncharacterized protein n=1 Tax=Ascodesmis nigricans TaxID=341454 RepID=A0A4V3SIE6_9PEZI|nr:hypothetical protein EX30DRAFT_380002 [Ascodesmis nigricans]
MRGLIGESAGNLSVYQQFLSIFNDKSTSSGSVIMEITEGKVHTLSIHPSIEIKQMDLHYLQLLLFAMRHFPDLIPSTPRKEKKQAVPTVREKNVMRWYSFARLAKKLGFSSPNIETLLRDDPYEKAVTHFLAQMFPEYGIVGNPSSVYATTMLLREISQNTMNHVSASLEGQSSSDLSRRCGRPYENDHNRDITRLFIHNVLQELMELLAKRKLDESIDLRDGDDDEIRPSKSRRREDVQCSEPSAVDSSRFSTRDRMTSGNSVMGQCIELRGDDAMVDDVL